MKQWTVSNLDDSKYLGVIEFQSNNEEFHNFEVMETKDRLVFGGLCNVGFIESGYMEKDTDFSTDENLQEMLEDLEVYYNDGKEFVSKDRKQYPLPIEIAYIVAVKKLKREVETI